MSSKFYKELEEAGMTRADLVEAIEGFYAYHDPVKPRKEIDNVLKYAEGKGVRALNAKLREKYGEDLFVGAETEGGNGKLESTAIPMRYRGSVILLQTPSIGEMTQYEGDINEKLEKLLDKLSKSNGTKEMEENLVAFYRVATPERFTATNGAREPFIEEILIWTYRFGMRALLNNLRTRYLEEEASSKSTNQVDSPRAKVIPKESQLEELRDRLKAFYKHYNPSRLREGVSDLVVFAKKRGLAALNAKLRERYEDDLDSFEKVQLGAREFKEKLFDRLFEFYSVYDQQQINLGMGKVVAWAVKHGEAALNEELQKRYGLDLNEFEDISNKLNGTEERQAPPIVLEELRKLA